MLTQLIHRYLNTFPVNNVSRVIYIFLKQRNMEYIVNIGSATDKLLVPLRQGSGRAHRIEG